MAECRGQENAQYEHHIEHHPEAEEHERDERRPQSVAACDRRALRHRRCHRHRSFDLYADPAAHGGRAASDKGRGGPDRLGQLRGLSRRCSGGGIAPPGRGAARLAASGARHQRRHHRRHGVARWHGGLLGAALHRGVASAYVLVLASALVLERLNAVGQGHLSAVHFWVWARA